MILVEKLIEIINRDKQARIVEDNVITYSGRYMFGKCCLGIVCSNPFFILGVLVSLCETDKERLLVTDLFSDTKEDSLGLDKVIYWPSLEVKENWEVS